MMKAIFLACAMLGITLASTSISANTSYTRKSIYNMTDAEIREYARGVKALKALPKTDARNWFYQSGIHGHLNPNISNPNLKPYSLDPALYNVQNNAWDRCHTWASGTNSDLFLLWHRVYIYYLEQSMRSVLNNPNFALPYWDYTSMSDLDRRKLPAAFRMLRLSANTVPRTLTNTQSILTLPNNQTRLLEISPNLTRLQRNGVLNNLRLYNELYAVRDAALMQGQRIQIGDNALKDFINKSNYLEFSQGLENNLHGPIHMNIGNSQQSNVVMGNVNIAAQDPIFYLHHANVDRIWSCWETRYRNLDQSQLAGVFYFPKADGTLQSLTVRQMYDLAKNMNYRYDSMQDCQAQMRPRLTLNDKIIRMKFPKPIVINQRLQQFPLSQQSELQPQVKMAASTALAGGKLVLSNIQAPDNLGAVYQVYLTDGGKLRSFVGTIAFFGHAQHNMNLEFDIEDEVQQLQRQGVKPTQFTIEIEPKDATVQAKDHLTIQALELQLIPK